MRRCRQILLFRVLRYRLPDLESELLFVSAAQPEILSVNNIIESSVRYFTVNFLWLYFFTVSSVTLCNDLFIARSPFFDMFLRCSQFLFFGNIYFFLIDDLIDIEIESQYNFFDLIYS